MKTPEVNPNPHGANIQKCTCEHEYQDSRYGPYMRVHTSCVKPPILWRCTVCSKEKR